MGEINRKANGEPVSGDEASHLASGRPTPAQLRYLRLGLRQPGGKLPLFDAHGQEIDPRTIRSCVDRGWAQPWFKNPVHPGWLVCRLTDAGRDAAGS